MAGLISCADSNGKDSQQTGSAKPAVVQKVKPPASFQDTLTIDKRSAIFYIPDSLQLERIKVITEPGVFESAQHEYYFQMRNARIVLHSNWPEVKIIEARQLRFLRFKRVNGRDTLIDLNTKNDPYGLFLFTPGKAPRLTDMTNIETELYFYFKKT
ncbi:MAG: hypothetical protein GC171_08540 [Terrimonas sp.]|nr:hypothetical protein [Terrimonas sp.]